MKVSLVVVVLVLTGDQVRQVGAGDGAGAVHPPATSNWNGALLVGGSAVDEDCPQRLAQVEAAAVPAKHPPAPAAIGPVNRRLMVW